MVSAPPPLLILRDPAGLTMVCKLFLATDWYVCGFRVVVYAGDPGNRRPK
jgi:hypothetical protein